MKPGDAADRGAAARLLPASIIIPSRNRPHLLPDTIDSILAHEDLPAEIIIVDQSDEPCALYPDGTVIRGCAVRYVPSPTRGVSAARNVGARLARSEVLVFTDDDLIAQPQWLASAVSALLAAGPSDAVTGRVLAGPPETPGGFAPAQVRREHPVTFEGRITSDPLHGANMALRASTFMALGEFDERIGPGTRFPAGEDNDLGFLLLEAGGKILYVPEAVLHHRAWRPASAQIKHFFGYGRGKGAYYAKHMTLRDRHMLRRMFQEMGSHVVRAVQGVRKPWRAAGEVAFSAGIVRGVVEWYIRRPQPPPQGGRP